MPVLAASAYNTAEDVLTRVRTILNDSEVAGGDVITDSAPFAFDLINAGFERVQLELAQYGIEVQTAEAWFLALPTMPTIDPEGRMIIDDSGCNIIYPNGVGNVFSNTPQLPTDLILPLKLWERQTGMATGSDPMRQPNGGLLNMNQSNSLVDWEWQSDGLRFRGSLQSRDVKLKYEKHLQKLAAPTDPVPIRGVLNAAAYQAAKMFADSRGGLIAPEAKLTAAEEIQLYAHISARYIGNSKSRVASNKRRLSGKFFA